MRYSVGQILYVASRQTMSVYPVQVTQEITKKTLGNDVETTYMVMSPVLDHEILITSINDDIYDSAEAVRENLTNKAAESIANIVKRAASKARELFPTGQQAAQLPGDHASESPPKFDASDMLPEEGSIVEIGGQVVKIRSIKTA